MRFSSHCAQESPPLPFPPIPVWSTWQSGITNPHINAQVGRATAWNIPEPSPRNLPLLLLLLTLEIKTQLLVLPVPPSQAPLKTQVCVDEYPWNDTDLCAPTASAAPWTPKIPSMRQEGSMEQDLGGAFITWTRSPEGPRDEGTRGTGSSILGSQEILLQPWEALPWSTGRRKTPSGTLQALHTHCVSGGMGSSASEGFPIPGFPTKPLEPGQELALALLGAQGAGVRSWVWVRPWLLGRTTPGEWRGAMN